MPPSDTKSSKFLSLLLRHDPAKAGLTLDAAGWVDVDALLSAVNRAGIPLNLTTLQRVVAENDKQRFAFSEDGTKIRANQGHSIQVELGLQPIIPPALLYHGTAMRFVDAIRQEGLHPMSRRHVHLSTDPDTALNVGLRHGTPIVLEVHAERMHATGHIFFRSDNGVWLTERVPVEFLTFPE